MPSLSIPRLTSVSPGRLVTYLLIVTVATACSPALPPPTLPIGTAPAPTGLNAAIMEAIRFRTEFGLRADEAFVQSVATDPTAVSVPFGVPLLPEESAELQGRAKTAEELTTIVRRYGLTVPGSYGGQFVEPSTGEVVALFVGDLAKPSQALHSLASPSAPLRLVSVRYPLRFLESVMASLDLQQPWLKSRGMQLRGAGVEIANNQVWVMVANLIPGGLEELAQHLGVPTDLLRLTVEPDPLAALPRGRTRDIPRQLGKLRRVLTRWEAVRLRGQRDFRPRVCFQKARRQAEA